MNEHDPTYMLWQNIDTDKHVTSEMVIQWGIKHFEEKYGQKVVHIAHNEKLMSTELETLFPGISFSVDPKVFDASMFFVYAKETPKHKTEESDGQEIT